MATVTPAASNGNDTIFGSNNEDDHFVVDFLDGDDFFGGLRESSFLQMGERNDQVQAGLSSTAFGGNGNDLMSGSSNGGFYKFYGQAGHDQIFSLGGVGTYMSEVRATTASP